MKSPKSDDEFFAAESPAVKPTGRESRTLCQYNDAMAVPASALADAAAEGDDRYRPAVTCVLLLLQVMARDRDFPRIFIRRLHTALSLAGSSYVQEILLLALAGQPLPGPLELAERHGISKQAVSREILDAIARIRTEEPLLADLLESARIQYHFDDPAGARAPHPRAHEYAVPLSACDGRTVIQVEFRDGAQPATMRHAAGVLTFSLVDGGAERTCPRGAAKLVVEETDRGTVVSVPFVRAAA